MSMSTFNNNIFKAPNLVPRDYSKRIHTHAHPQTEAPAHTSINYDHTKLNYTQLKTGSKRPGDLHD